MSLACVDGGCAGSDLRPRQISGCLSVKGVPAAARTVRLSQPDEPRQTERTDVRGCFEFEVVTGKPFDVQIPEDDLP